MNEPEIEVEIVAITEEEEARIDALARAYGVSRDELIDTLVRAGVSAEERRLVLDSLEAPS